MDTTVTLIISLGLALGGQNSLTPGHETAPAQVQNTQLSQRQRKVQQRIKLTNSWLKQQKQARQHHQKITPLTRLLSCTADWDTA